MRSRGSGRHEAGRPGGGGDGGAGRRGGLEREHAVGRRDFLALGVGALVVAAAPAGLRRRPRLVRRRIPVMGTVAEIAVPTRNEAWAQTAMNAAFAQLRHVESTMSRFLGVSDVGRLNAGAGGWVDVSPDTGHVLGRALAWSERSEGRFDPCLARAVELWDVTRRDAVPDDEELQGFVDAGLWRALEVEADGSRARARLALPRAGVDLGGIAKGHAVDAAAEALRGFGVTDALVNVGGDLVALGADAAGDPWVVGVRSPYDPDGVAARLEVADEAVATSGDYLRYFQHGGERYHHLIDPTSGRPIRTPMRSLTVRAERCIDADAAATALYGASPSQRLRLLERTPDAVRIVHHITERTT